MSAQRARVLEQLQSCGPSATITTLAAALGLHTNTVREHLDELVKRGMVSRDFARPVGRGRPAAMYTATTDGPGSDPRAREYAGLATALAGQIARSSPDPQADALAAGEAWGGSLVVGIPVGSPARARRRVLSLLTDLGFDPEADARATTARLLRCPLLHAAREHPEIVCRVHLGLVRGALESVGGDPDGAALLPFSEPGACRLHLHARPPKVRA
jgi:predicted ArsR family transcriptional regulator